MVSRMISPEGANDMRVRAVLFDLFGTLVTYHAGDRRRDLDFGPATAVLREAGMSVTESEWHYVWARAFDINEQRVQGTGVEFALEAVWDTFCNSMSIAPSLATTSAFLEAYRGCWKAGVDLMPGAVEVLDRLRSQDYLLSLVSNTHDARLVEDVLTDHGLNEYFSRPVTSIEIGFRKPRREILEFALRDIGVTSSEAVFVGDTYEIDIIGAASIGMPCVLLSPDDGPLLGLDCVQIASLTGLLDVLDVEDR